MFYKTNLKLLALVKIYLIVYTRSIQLRIVYITNILHMSHIKIRQADEEINTYTYIRKIT